LGRRSGYGGGLSNLWSSQWLSRCCLRCNAGRHGFGCNLIGGYWLQDWLDLIGLSQLRHCLCRLLHCGGCLYCAFCRRLLGRLLTEGQRGRLVTLGGVLRGFWLLYKGLIDLGWVLRGHIGGLTGVQILTGRLHCLRNFKL